MASRTRLPNGSYASVACTESGGGDCVLCLGLADDLGCGWCAADRVCAASNQCKVRIRRGSGRRLCFPPGAF